jgi:hypothetical protein
VIISFHTPYCSWERGLNENHNELIRSYLPKGMALDKVTGAKIKFIQDSLISSRRYRSSPWEIRWLVKVFSAIDLGMISGGELFLDYISN